MGKLQNITLDKLSGIRPGLVRSDDDWQEWIYVELIEALKKWNEKISVPSTETLGFTGLINILGETSLNITLSETESFIPKKVIP